jgi:hypothetical protein
MDSVLKLFEFDGQLRISFDTDICVTAADYKMLFHV